MFNPAGGLLYHFKAFYHREGYWKPFRQLIGQWLEQWLAEALKVNRRLIIVGPSGGYCLPIQFMRNFDRLLLIDPDPLGVLLFRQRLKSIGKTVWINRDFFTQESEIELKQWKAFLAEESNTPVLFSNFIGQLFLLTSESTFKQIRSSLVPSLQNRIWASFHDRFSGSISPMNAGFDEKPLEYQLEDDEVLNRFYTGQRFKQKELQDHQTLGFFPKHLPYFYFPWRLDRESHHLIEAVSFPPVVRTLPLLRLES